MCQVAVPNLFATPRLALFDLYEQVAPRHRDPALAPVVVVAIDDASLKAFGPWPWPRALQARLIGAILRGGPAAVGIDEVWSEGDRTTANGATAAGDQDLVEALRSGPAAIGVAGSQDTAIEGGTGTFAPVVYRGPAGPLTDLFSFASELRSVLTIDLAAAGHGLMSNDPDADGVSATSAWSPPSPEPRPPISASRSIAWPRARRTSRSIHRAAAGGWPGSASGPRPSRPGATAACGSTIRVIRGW